MELAVVRRPARRRRARASAGQLRAGGTGAGRRRRQGRQAVARAPEAHGTTAPPSRRSCRRTLQAELRDYQVEGFEWLARLAHWGVGACLADDMGLGKTLQALALMLSRAPQGPTLVVAPTSVCMNWMSEAARFAPTLNVKLFGAGRPRRDARRGRAVRPGDRQLRPAAAGSASCSPRCAGTPSCSTKRRRSRTPPPSARRP